MRLQIIDQNEGHSCNGCSNCCQQPYSIVIEKEKALALSKADFSAYPQLQGQDDFYHESNDVPEGFFVLKKQEGTTRCIFLDADGLCIIHRELGATAKPTPCQKFPLHDSITFVDQRVSVNFGCPSVISDKEQRLREQEADVAAIVTVPAVPTDSNAFVSLDNVTGMQHDEYDALAQGLERLFDPERPTSIWNAFAASLHLVEAAIAKKKADEPDLIEWMAEETTLERMQQQASVVPLLSIPAAASPVRMRFAATMMRDALPKEVTLNMSLWRRIASLPKLMPLVKLTGSYFSKVQQREIEIDRVVQHSVPGGIEDAATVVLKRCFRARIWQRFLIGTRLSVVGGLHQHIHDLNAILFLSLSDAFYKNESQLTKATVGDNLSRFEFNFANQARLFKNNGISWFNNQLNDASLAHESLRMFALATPVNATGGHSSQTGIVVPGLSTTGTLSLTDEMS